MKTLTPNIQDEDLHYPPKTPWAIITRRPSAPTCPCPCPWLAATAAPAAAAEPWLSRSTAPLRQWFDAPVRLSPTPTSNDFASARNLSDVHSERGPERQSTATATATATKRADRSWACGAARAICALGPFANVGLLNVDLGWCKQCLEWIGGGKRIGFWGGGAGLPFELLGGGRPGGLLIRGVDGKGEWENLVLKDASVSSDPSKPNVWGQEFAGRLIALKAMHRRLYTRLQNSVLAPLEQFLLTKRRQATSLSVFQESLRVCWERWTMKEVRDFARVLSDHVPELIWLTELTLSAELGVLFCSDFFNQDLSDLYVHFEARTPTQPNYGWRWPPLTPVVIDPYKTLQKLATQLCKAVHHWTSSSSYSDQQWNLEHLSTIVRDTLDVVLDECIPLPVPKERDLIDKAQREAKTQQQTHAELMHLFQHRQPWLTTLDGIWKTRDRQNAQLMEKSELAYKESDTRNEAARELKIQERNWQQRIAAEGINNLVQIVQLGEPLRQLLSSSQNTVEQQSHLGRQIAALNSTLVSFGTHLFSTVNSIRPAINSIATSTATTANASLSAANRPPQPPNAPIWPAINWTAPRIQPPPLLPFPRRQVLPLLPSPCLVSQQHRPQSQPC